MRCINCGLAIQRSRRHLISSLSEQLQKRLSRWIANAPQLPLDTLICNSCFLLLNTEAGEHERLLGHNMVCLVCGKSVLRLKHYNVSKESPLLAVLLPQNTNYLPLSSNCLCHVCWLRGSRQAGLRLPRQRQELASDSNAAAPNLQMVSRPESPLLPPVQNGPPRWKDSKNENNIYLSNLAPCWKSATGELQHGDQPGSNHPALSDADDDAGSSDDDNIQELPPPPQLNLHTAQMCRVCLALDVKMFDLRDNELKTMFQMTTGITFEENEGSKLGSLICWECAARLKAAARFRSKALFSDSLLQGFISEGEQMEKQYFEAVKKEANSLTSPKALSVTEIFHIVEIVDQNNMAQLVQSRDDDEPSLSKNNETEIKDEICDEHSGMDLGDDNIDIKTEMEDDPTCLYTGEQNRTIMLKEYPLDSTSSNEGTINSGYSHLLLDISHTSLRSDSPSSQEDYDDQISKTIIETITKSKIRTERSKELKTPVKRSKVALSHDHTYYSKEDSENINKNKKIKKFVGLLKKLQEKHKSSKARRPLSVGIGAAR